MLGYVLEPWKHVLRVELGLGCVVCDDIGEGNWVGSKGKKRDRGHSSDLESIYVVPYA